jgi:hypothetical protein
VEQQGMENQVISASTEAAQTDSRLLMLELAPHQRTALTQLGDGKILWGGVGTGKSRVAVGYYTQNHMGKDVYVITTAKKRDSLDWEDEFSKFIIGKEPDATIGGILTVDSWNNLQKYKDIQNAFFIFDEQRLVGHGSWVKSFLKVSKNNSWIMLSATPGDTWMDYIPVFVANGFYNNRTAFIREHVVYKPFQRYPVVDHYAGEGHLLKLRNQILVHMPYPKMTVRHDKTVYVDHNEELLTHVLKKRWHIYADRPIKDIAELFGVMRRVVNSDPNRVRTIKRLLREHPKIIVFYNFDYELEALRGLQSVTEVSELNGHKHEEIPTTDSWVYLVQYVAGSEAWNCVETNCIVFYSLTYSYKHWEQAHGRIDRMDTPFIDLYYYVFRSKSWLDNAIWSALKVKRNFNAAGYDLSQVKIG